MYRRLLLIFLLASPLLTIADASPKFSEEVTISIVDEQGTQPPIDSICVIVPGRQTEIATLHYDTEQYWTGPTLRAEQGNFVLFTHGELNHFSVVLFADGQKYTTPVLPRYFGNNVFILKLDKDNITDVSPFFHQTWSSYFSSLFLTIVIELLLGLAFFLRNKNNKTLKGYLLTFTLVNMVTHFLLWLIYCNAFIPLFFLELIVVLVESAFWNFYLKFSTLKAFLISLLTNFGSWIISTLFTLLL